MRLRRLRLCDPTKSLLNEKNGCHEELPDVRLGHDEATTLATSCILKAWQTSRRATGVDSSPSNIHSPSPTFFFQSGVPRKFTVTNFRIAAFLVSQCWLDVARIVLGLHPIRMPLMILFTLIQGTIPAYQTYSQATILDEVRARLTPIIAMRVTNLRFFASYVGQMQRLLTTGHVWPSDRAFMPIVHLLFWELCRTVLIRVFETYV